MFIPVSIEQKQLMTFRVDENTTQRCTNEEDVKRESRKRSKKKERQRERERVGLKRGTVKFSPPRNCYYSRSIYERDI